MNPKVHPEVDLQRHQQDLHDHHNTDPSTLERVLLRVVQTLDEAQIPYGLIGGLAVKGMGRPRITNDIDIFVSPDDAERVMNILGEKGFKTEIRDPHWLFKAWDQDVLVDIIFKSSGDIYFDDEMRKRVKSITHQGLEVKTVSPEDFVVIKSAVHEEHVPHHWHDALAVITHADIDWDYLLRRARHAPRRVLSLLIYAQSNDLRVPNHIIRELFQSLYEERDQQTSGLSLIKTPAKKPSEAYLSGRIKSALDAHEKTAGQNIEIAVSGSKVIAKGEVFNRETQDAALRLIENLVPAYFVENRIRVRKLPDPDESEAI